MTAWCCGCVEMFDYSRADESPVNRLGAAPEQLWPHMQNIMLAIRDLGLGNLTSRWVASQATSVVQLLYSLCTAPGKHSVLCCAAINTQGAGALSVLFMQAFAS